MDQIKKHPFLNLNVSLSVNNFTTNLYTASIDKHQHLHYPSIHPVHTKRSIISSQALRMGRIYFYKTDFEKHLVNMKSWFQATRPGSALVQKELNKVTFSGDVDKNKSKKMSNRVQFSLLFTLY